MDKTNFTITIKNVPTQELEQLWADNMKYMIEHMGEVAEKSNNVEVDFEYAMKTHPEGFFQIIAAGFTLQAMKTAVKIIKE